MKNVAIYALLRCKIFCLKIWLCKIFDKFHVCVTTAEQQKNKPYWNSDLSQASSTPPTFFISFHTSTLILSLSRSLSLSLSLWYLHPLWYFPQASSNPPTFCTSFHTSTTRSTGSLYVQGNQLQPSHITFYENFQHTLNNLHSALMGGYCYQKYFSAFSWSSLWRLSDTLLFADLTITERFRRIAAGDSFPREIELMCW